MSMGKFDRDGQIKFGKLQKKNEDELPTRTHKKERIIHQEAVMSGRIIKSKKKPGAGRQPAARNPAPCVRRFAGTNRPAGVLTCPRGVCACGGVAVGCQIIRTVQWKPRLLLANHMFATAMRRAGNKGVWFLVPVITGNHSRRARQGAGDPINNQSKLLSYYQLHPGLCYGLSCIAVSNYLS